MIPDDLAPLPTAPYDQRPIDLPLVVQEVRTALWLEEGNVTRAAARLKVPSIRLRNFIERSQYLRREVEEAREQLADEAETVVRDALHDPDRCDSMARFVLTNIGKRRGWGTGSGGNSVNINKPTGPISITWEDGSTISVGTTEPATIEGEVIDG